MIRPDTTRPVMVTGGTGYVGGWIVRRLLEEGLTVHAAVRDPEDAAKTAHLVRLAETTTGSLRLFGADLLEDGSYAPAMEGCAVVFHAASPFRNSVEDPQRDLVDPAVDGTRNVLAQANRTGGVERVVLTSSCAAIYGDCADVARVPGGVLTEDLWNTSSSLGHSPYSHSKTLAEREAWRIAEGQDRWRLVAVNPSFVLGPGTRVHPESESFRLMTQIGNGTFRMGVPRWGIGVVDVRDVAEAHLRAAFLPDAEGRHIVSAENSDFFEVARSLWEPFGRDHPLPRRALPKWLVWLAGPLADRALTRKAVALNVDIPWRADNSKSREKLGLDYRPMAETTRDMFRQLVEAGVLKHR